MGENAQDLCMGKAEKITQFPSNQEGSSHFSPGMTAFLDLIFKLDLIDLPLVGGAFAWSNGRNWSHLDRFLISTSWKALFLTLVRRLLRICSDHYPIMLDCEGVTGGHRYFKFETMWLKDEDFVERVRLW